MGEAPEAQGVADPSVILGRVDRLNGELLVGWIARSDASGRQLDVDVEVDGERIARVRADVYRSDLEAAGIGDGRHGFRAPLPMRLFDGRRRRVQALEAETGRPLGEAQTIDFPRLTSSEVIGSIDLFSGRTLIGWVQDQGDPDRRLGLEVLVDGEVVAAYLADIFRSDLHAAGIGDGCYGFAVDLPAVVFDGAIHDVTVRESGGAAVKTLTGVTLDAALGLDIVGEVTDLRGAALTGWARNRMTPDSPLNLFLAVDGLAAARTRAAPSSRDGTSGGGFAFDLSGLAPAKLARAETIEVRTEPDGVLVGQLTDFARRYARAHALAQSGGVSVTIALAFPPAQPVEFELLLDGAPFSRVRADAASAARGLQVRIPASSLTGGEHQVAVRFAGGLPVGGSPLVARVGSGRNVLTNPRFRSWAGALPSDWSVRLGSGARLSRGYSAEDAKKPPFAANAVCVWGEAGGAEPMLCLSQTIDKSEIEGDLLDVVVRGRAERRAEIQVSLTFEADGEEPLTLREGATLWPEWGMRAVRFKTPAQVKGPLRLDVSLAAAGAGTQISLIAAGAPQFALDEDSEPAGAEWQTNAVVNGDFAHWTGPLLASAHETRVRLTEGWSLAGKQANPGLRSRLTELHTRDPRHGEVGTHAYGVALCGQILGAHLRLEAELDKLQLSAAPASELSFFARRTGEAAGSDVSRIAEVLLVQRRLHEGGGHSDTKLATIGRRVDIKPLGQTLCLPVGAAEAAKTQDAASLQLHDPGCQLLLVFEFAGAVDVALTHVRLGSATSGPAPEPAPGYVGIEDPNITAQLGLLKGLELWGSPDRLESPSGPGRSELRVRQNAPVGWAWPEGSAGSVDIVVCVHEALSETLECLRSLETNTDLPHTVTVVDDGSCDLTRASLREHVRWRPWMRLVELPENLGYTRAANVGMSRSTAEWVVLLNSDTVVTRGWLRGLLEAAAAHPKAAMVGPLSNAATWQSVPDLYDARGKWKVNPLPEGLSIEAVAAHVRRLSKCKFPEVPLLNGFCTLLRRSAVEAAGFLDEAAFPVGYGEETDLCVRLRKAGWTLCVADHVYVYHVKSASFGAARRDELSRRGSEQFKVKHPDIDLVEAQRLMAEAKPLIDMRDALRAAAYGGHRPEPAGETAP